jgi:2-dehydro-3-deoxyglucarate aldolase/4-hydroxy-2-oxoheptanedioate aldolase
LSIVPPNVLRKKLNEGHLAVGCMLVEVRQPSIMVILANAGFDWVIIDNEHGPFSVETIADLSRAGREAGVTPVVRIPELTYAHVAQSLDGGAQGIMLPRVTARAQVEQCLEFMKYPPVGRRGAVLGRGHTGFKGGGLSEVLAAFNRETFLVVQIETREAVEGLDDILSVPGVDAALVGPTDPSLSLGVPGEMSAVLLTGAIEKTLAACAKHKVIPAIHTNDVAMTTAWARKGMRLVSINSEVGLLTSGAKAAVGQIRA